MQSQMMTQMEKEMEVKEVLSAARREASKARALVASMIAERTACVVKTDSSRAAEVHLCLRSSFLTHILYFRPMPTRDVERTSVTVSLDCSREAILELLRLSPLLQDDGLASWARALCVS